MRLLQQRRKVQQNLAAQSTCVLKQHLLQRVALRLFVPRLRAARSTTLRFAPWAGRSEEQTALLHGGTVAGVPFGCHIFLRREANKKWRSFATCRGRALLNKFSPVQVHNTPSGAAQVPSLAAQG